MEFLSLQPDTISKLRADLGTDALARRFFAASSSRRFQYRAKLLHGAAVTHVLLSYRVVGAEIELRKTRLVLKRKDTPDYGFTLDDNRLVITGADEAQAAGIVLETLQAACRSGVKRYVVASSA